MAMVCSKGGSECDGCMMCQPEPPKCEVCDKEFDYAYKDIDGEIVGCDNCILKVDCWEIN